MIQAAYNFCRTSLRDARWEVTIWEASIFLRPLESWSRHGIALSDNIQK